MFEITALGRWPSSAASSVLSHCLGAEGGGWVGSMASE